jgi:hypothetical protein
MVLLGGPPDDICFVVAVVAAVGVAWGFNAVRVHLQCH